MHSTSESFESQENQEEIVDEIEIYHCPNCFANLTFNMASQSLKCEYCETVIDISSIDSVQEYDFSDLELLTTQANWNQEAIAFQCETCGAQLISDPHLATTACPYCGSSHILIEHQYSGMKPEGIILFKVDESQAKESFKKWIRSQWLAPNNFKREYQTQEFYALYIPCWTYDANASTSYRAQGGTYYYVTVRGANGKTRRSRRTRWTLVSGHLGHFFDDVVVSASKGVDTSLLKKVEPFSTTSCLPYEPEYLSGYRAERYVVDAKESFTQAKSRMDEGLKKLIKTELLKRYDTVGRIDTNPVFQQVKFKHVLLPIWTATYTYRNKVYQCVLNGETGKIEGDAPKSFWKQLLIYILCIGAVYHTVKYADSVSGAFIYQFYF